jgi:hypothetical protein
MIQRSKPANSLKLHVLCGSVIAARGLHASGKCKILAQRLSSCASLHNRLRTGIVTVTSPYRSCANCDLLRVVRLLEFARLAWPATILLTA